MEKERISLPMVALRGMVVLPEMVTHFDISREKSIQAVERAMAGEQLIFLAAQKDVEIEEPGASDVYETGCVASIKQVLKLPKKITRVLVAGQMRAHLEELEQESPFLYASVQVIKDMKSGQEDAAVNREAMLRGLKERLGNIWGKILKPRRNWGSRSRRPWILGNW